LKAKHGDWDLAVNGKKPFPIKGTGPMRIAELRPQPGWRLSIVAEDGRFDVTPYFEYEAFEELRDPHEFMKVINGGYFIEWECGADLSADTIEVQWQVTGKATPQATV
jgi:hypothetical protein